MATPASVYDPAIRSTRKPWVLTTQRRLKGIRFQNLSNDHILINVNPGEYSISLPFRQSETISKDGHVTHNWRHPRTGSMYQYPTITISFTTGNILPRVSQEYINRAREVSAALASGSSPDTGFTTIPRKEDITNIPPGLENLYAFLELVDEDKVLSTGEVNHAVLYMHSLAFPKLTLKGFFVNEINWSENADHPSEITWQGTMIVHKTTPEIGVNGFFKLKQEYEREITAGVESVITGNQVDAATLTQRIFGDIAPPQ